MKSHTHEAEVQRHHLTAYLIKPAPDGGLGWQEGAADRIDPETLLIKSDLMAFLAHGNEANKSAWENLWRQCNRDETDVWIAVKEAVVVAMRHATTNVQILRDGVKIKGIAFSLWNQPPHRSSLNASIRANEFGRNCLRVTNEARFAWRFVAKVGSNRRPDQVFHVNGLYFAMAELKTKQTGQSAVINGRDKIVSDYREFAYGALLDARSEWDKVYGAAKEWPGFSRLPEQQQKDLLARVPGYEKAAWAIAVDMGDVWLMPSFDGWMSVCDESIARGLREPHQDEKLREKMLSDFTQMPPIAGLSAWEEVTAHLAGLLDPIRGVGQEIAFFHYPRNDKITRGKDFLRPRTPQRVFMERLTQRVPELYARESDPEWVEKDLRAKIALSMPNLEEEKVARIIADRLKYRNGQEAYSILFQGAAGLGKTNLAVWSALYLYGLLAPRAEGQAQDAPRGPLFDRVVILTDRVELRDNIAQEAMRTSGTRDQILLADDKDVFRAALTGAPLPSHIKSTGGIVVVNLQKFPGLVETLAKDGDSITNGVGRTAFIIDEVHRSQNGTLNEQATDLFVNSLGDLAANAHGGKKNLVVGLTATPSDTILARLGEWRAPVSVSDANRWAPYFSYALQQAINDGFVLDPTQHVVPYNIDLDWNPAATALKVGGKDNLRPVATADKVYESPARQKLVAENFAKIFAEITMQAIPSKYIATRVGPAKAMVTVPSIKAAIGMQTAIKDALLDLAQNAAGTPWEHYAHIVKEVAEQRVFVLYSDTQIQGKGQTPCASLNEGLNEQQTIRAFRCADAKSNNQARNAIIVVVDKLLTGFDEPTLHTLLIDRSLTGIGLFQTMCRVNRQMEGKKNTLVLVTCHDETVKKDYPKVFKKYGGLAMSDLDGLDLIQQLDIRRQEILKSDVVEKIWKEWKKGAPATREEKTELTKKFSDAIEMLLEGQSARAKELRKTIGGYLSGQRLAKAIMQLEGKHTNDAGWLECLHEIHSMLKAGSPNERGGLEIDFDVRGIEFDDLMGLGEHETLADGRVKRKPDDSGLVGKILEGEEEGDGIIDSLTGKAMSLQEQEERKRKRSQEIRTILEELYGRIDQESLKDNEDAFRRSILSGAFVELDHERRIEWFLRIFARATGLAFRRKADNAKLVQLLSKWPDLLLHEYRERVIKGGGVSKSDSEAIPPIEEGAARAFAG